MPPNGPAQHGYSPGSGAPTQGYPGSMDTTGQIAPAGMKPRVTATLWEDEGSLCFQVEAKGVCVARREGMDPSLHQRACTILSRNAGKNKSATDAICRQSHDQRNQTSQRRRNDPRSSRWHFEK